MENNQQRVRHFIESDNENSQISSKRLKPTENEAQENIDPRTAFKQSFKSNMGSREKRQNKDSPVTKIILSEMGLDVLDTDSESNQSSVISNVLSSVPPSSAMSTLISETSSEPMSNYMIESHDICLESDSNITDDLRHDLEVSESPASTIFSNPPSNEKSFTVGAQQFSNHQDYTPANLVPLSRTNFVGIMNTSIACSSTQITQTIPEGRAIRGSSMKKMNSFESDSAKKHKGRSPLAAVSCNSPANIANTSIDIDAKKKISEEFFMYQRQDQRIYTGENNFARLSDEMILSVFKWLPKKALIRCSLVCQKFNRVARDESLWTRLDLASKTIQPYALGRILSHGLIILRLAQSRILEPIFKPNEILSDFLPKLQYLDLSMAIISTHSLEQLLSHCRRLKKLSLEHVPINDQICKHISNNKQMEVLNLTMSSGITRHGARKLLSSLKILHTLNISWTSLDMETIEEIPNYLCEKLQRLNIAGCREKLKDDCLEKLVKRCPQLQELDLSDCTKISSKTIDIMTNLKDLEYLSLSRCYNIGGNIFPEINKLESLVFLDIFGVLSEQALNLLSISLPSIGINKFIHSAVARPTVGSRRTSIWGLRTRD